MSEGKKMFIGAAGILLAVALIFVGVMIYNKGESSVTDAASKYDDFVSQFGDAELVMYENSTTSGSDVINLISSLDANTSYSVSVTNGASTTAVIYTADGVKESSTTTALSDAIARAKDKTKTDYYINPSATFTSTVTKDDNGVAIQVVFTQVK